MENRHPVPTPRKDSDGFQARSIEQHVYEVPLDAGTITSSPQPMYANSYVDPVPGGVVNPLPLPPRTNASHKNDASMQANQYRSSPVSSAHVTSSVHSTTTVGDSVRSNPHAFSPPYQGGDHAHQVLSPTHFGGGVDTHQPPPHVYQGLDSSQMGDDNHPYQDINPSHQGGGDHHVHNPSHQGGGGVSPGNKSDESGKLNILQQKEKEVYLLRMNVTDKDALIGKLNRDLDYCHHEIKQLNMHLTEKKENILQYQEKIAGMQAELAELRDKAMCAGGPKNPQDSGTSTAAEMALQAQVEQLSRHVTDIRRQLDESRRKNDQLEYQLQHHQQQPLWGGAMQHDQSRTEVNNLRGQNFDLKSKIEMLEVQVATYKEDFQIERSDRERAQAELHTIKEERESLKQAINMLSTEHGIRLDPRGLPLPP